MLKISFCAAEVDPDYSPIIGAQSPRAETLTESRRVSRVATLDGDSVLVDSGHGYGDKTITVHLDLDDATRSKLYALQEYFAEVHCSCESGCYTGTLSRLEFDDGRVKITYLARQKVS